ncbi:MAG: tail fiber domain-containing protein [Ferruginibacter sp.]|nr:tail fiber domain-containing protein [Bacteroidota bacterium]MBX2918624.1 tail fiber domain-containing protein [Ferruginibacter sp.]
MKKYFLILTAAVACSRFAAAQNVGIGTNNPFRAKLEVHGAVGATSAIFGGEGQGISLQRNFPSIGFNQFYGDMSRHMATGYSAVQYLDPWLGYMAIDMLGTGDAYNYAGPNIRAITINKNGNVGFRSNGAANTSLVVERAENTEGTAAFWGSRHISWFNYGAQENTYIRAGKDNGKVYINDIPGSKIAMYGFVGVNTDNPTFPLEVRQPAGTGDKGLGLFNPNINQSWELRVTQAQGVLNMYHTGSYVSSFNQWGVYSYVSDKRLKKNITALPTILSKVLQLQPVAYNMIDEQNAENKNLGFIAQDVQQLFPQLVSTLSDSASGHKGMNDVLTVNYDGFGILAIKAIQEQQQMIVSLTQKMESLQQEIKALKAGKK